MLTDLTPDDLADDEAMRQAAFRIAPTMPATVDQVYGWLLNVARVGDVLAGEPPDFTDFAERMDRFAKPRPEPDYRRGLRRPWWER